MPMNAAAGEALVAITAPGIPAVLLAAADPGVALDLLPVSAGLSGAVVATMKAHLLGVQVENPGGRWRWVGTVMSGAAAAIFVSPFLADLVALHAIRAAIFLHFVVGLLGSSLCDLILAQSGRLNSVFLNKMTGGLYPVKPPAMPQQKPEDAPPGP